jgi:hypothetical protein
MEVGGTVKPDEEALVDPDKLPDESELAEEAQPAELPATPTDRDEEVDAQAQGHNLTADDAPDGIGEIDEMGQAAGLAPDNDKPFRGIDAVERRDGHRWELDPRSAEDIAEREATD